MMTNEIQDEKLSEAIHGLPREMPPERDLWPGIAEKIAPSRRRLQPWPIAAAVAGLIAIGAIVAAVLLSRPVTEQRVVATTLPARRQPVNITMPKTVRAQTLAATVRRTTRLDPKTQAVLLRNLAIIENSLDNIQQTLQKNPDNIGLQRLLYQMYRSEAALMNAAQRVQLQSTTGVIAL